MHSSRMGLALTVVDHPGYDHTRLRMLTTDGEAFGFGLTISGQTSDSIDFFWDPVGGFVEWPAGSTLPGTTERPHSLNEDGVFWGFSAPNTAFVATPVVLNEPPDCAAAAPASGELWPPNHDFRQMSIAGVTDPDGDPITTTITGVSQDEPIESPGSGNTCPDGGGTDSDTALLRRERNGGSDGRVYHVSFRAEDGRGGECTGTVAVCQPHDQGQGEECIDQGPLFDSTGPCDASNDADGDGLLDAEEAAIGTHLLSPDSDGDGFSDAEEQAAGSDPTGQASIPGGGAAVTAVPALSTWGSALLVGLLVFPDLRLSRRWLVRSA